MMKFFKIYFVLTLIVLGNSAFNFFYVQAQQEGTVTIRATVQGCGDGSCSGSETCSSCPQDCGTCPPSGGGGGGGGFTPLTTTVVLKGKAYPGSDVNILKDGKSVSVIKTDSQADFKYEFSDITPGVYTFGIWAEDKDGIRSVIYTLTFLVSPNTLTTVSGIFLPPTIGVDKTTVKKGETINIFGQSVPKVEIDVRILSSEIIEKTTSDEIGAWLLKFNTQPLEEGFHTAAAQSQFNPNEKSGFGKTLSFNVGETVAPIVKGEEASDFNSDGKINLVDFSIFLSWFGKENPSYDLNNNGKVDLADFSIFLCYWTG